MKVKFEFDLPEEEPEYKMMQKAGDMHSCLYQFAMLLRTKTKYTDEIATDWTTVRALFWEIMDDYDIDPLS